jgi:very-short-patch-repair endonuclease
MMIAATFSHGTEALVFQLRALRLPQPVREHRFDPIRRWRFDLAWPDRFIAAEVDGGSWIAGRHTRGSGFEADCRKYAEAAIAGWRVIRVTTRMVDSGEAVALLERILR